MGSLLFVLLAVAAVASSVAMVVHRSPIYSALYMVVTFAATAVMFVLLDAPFIAALQIIVYAGAIIVLFLFVIMFLNLKGGVLIERRRGPLWMAIILGAVIAAELAAVVNQGTAAGGVRPAVPEGFGSVESVAGLLFTRYLVPFEITSILLIVGMMGAVVLARNEEALPGAMFDPPGMGSTEERNDPAAASTGEEPQVVAAGDPSR